jgi:D-alanyl-D-alanine carboxypeptidase
MLHACYHPQINDGHASNDKSASGRETVAATQILTALRLWSHALIAITLLALPADAAPFAAYVMDARTGQPIYRQNADTRLHPASLTKMMTLYMTFSAIEHGQVSLNSKFTISSNAASEPPSKLAFGPGSRSSCAI